MYSKDFLVLNNIISKYKAKFYSKRVGVEITNFRHLEFYISNLPLGIKNIFIQNNLILTTKALSNLFPFFSENIIDLNGIQFGYTHSNKQICMIDIFSSKYENSNVCIFGMSGSGKSYFTKLCILRNFFKKKIQIVFDVENEYYNLCKNLGGCNLFSDTYFNIFQINYWEIQDEDFLDKKIDKISNFLMDVLEVKIDILNLKNEIKLLYDSFNITSDISSVLKKQDGKEVDLDNNLIEYDKFPTLIDLKNFTKYKTLKKALEESLKSSLKPFITGQNIQLNNKLYVLNMANFMQNKAILTHIINYIKDNVLSQMEIIIYFDELFKYCNFEEVLFLIVELYKTIRKRKGAIVTITQDISDFFKYKEGIYANSVLNNSCFKMFFKTEYEDFNRVEKIIKIEKDKLSLLQRGEMYVSINNNYIRLQVASNEFERALINEDDYCN